jgi:hypothetical protein
MEGCDTRKEGLPALSFLEWRWGRSRARRRKDVTYSSSKVPLVSIIPFICLLRTKSSKPSVVQYSHGLVFSYVFAFVFIAWSSGISQQLCDSDCLHDVLHPKSCSSFSR